ncbi:MAG: GTPase Era [Pseudomonadota bacterium]
MTKAPPAADQRTALIAIIGPTNAGKSSLVNALVGAPVSAVTHKRQTTRFRLRGVTTRDDTQIVLVDTPGIANNHNRYQRVMIGDPWAALEDVDGVLVMLDAAVRAQPFDFARLETTLARAPSPPPCALVLNKIDRVKPKTRLLESAADYQSRMDFSALFMISATQSKGLDALWDWFQGRTKNAPWLYHADQVSELTSSAWAQEVTREQATLRLHQELPYTLTVQTERWEETPKGIVAEQILLVASPSHRSIVIGAGGHTIKAISQAARRALIVGLGHPVELLVTVKVAKKRRS